MLRLIVLAAMVCAMIAAVPATKPDGPVSDDLALRPGNGWYIVDGLSRKGEKTTVVMQGKSASEAAAAAEKQKLKKGTGVAHLPHTEHEQQLIQDAIKSAPATRPTSRPTSFKVERGMKLADVEAATKTKAVLRSEGRDGVKVYRLTLDDLSDPSYDMSRIYTLDVENETIVAFEVRSENRPKRLAPAVPMRRPG